MTYKRHTWVIASGVTIWTKRLLWSSASQRAISQFSPLSLFFTLQRDTSPCSADGKYNRLLRGCSSTGRSVGS